MGSKPDTTKDGRPRPDSPGHPDLPAPPAPADQQQRQQLQDRLAAAHDTDPSLPKLRERAGRLPPGSPSSPCAEDGTRRPPEPSLKEVELPEPPLTDAQWADHRHEVTDRLDKAAADGQSTNALHTIGPDHEEWTLERAQVHKQIIAELYERATGVPCDRQAIIAGGLAGAGKSTVLGKHAIIDRSAYLTVNPDDFKEELARRGLLPDIPGLSPMETSSLAHEESSYLARQLARRAIADGKNIIWDITMSRADSTTGRMVELRAAGYENVEGIYVDIPVDESIGRAEGRHRRDHELYLAGQSVGGRCVTPEITRRQADPEFGSINRRVFEEVKDQFDKWSVYDNSRDGGVPVLVAHGRRGDLSRPDTID